MSEIMTQVPGAQKGKRSRHSHAPLIRSIQCVCVCVCVGVLRGTPLAKKNSDMIHGDNGGIDGDNV